MSTLPFSKGATVLMQTSGLSVFWHICKSSGGAAARLLRIKGEVSCGVVISKVVVVVVVDGEGAKEVASLRWDAAEEEGRRREVETMRRWRKRMVVVDLGISILFPFLLF